MTEFIQAATADLLDELFVAPQDLPRFEKLRDNIAAELAPASTVQAELVRTIIHCKWTIRRTCIIERKMQQRAFDENYIDPILDAEWSAQLKDVLAMRRQAERRENKAMRELLAARKTSGKPKVMAAAAASVEPQRQPFILKARDIEAVETNEAGKGRLAAAVVSLPKIA